MCPNPIKSALCITSQKYARKAKLLFLLPPPPPNSGSLGACPDPPPNPHSPCQLAPVGHRAHWRLPRLQQRHPLGAVSVGGGLLGQIGRDCPCRFSPPYRSSTSPQAWTVRSLSTCCASPPFLVVCSDYVSGKSTNQCGIGARNPACKLQPRLLNPPFDPDLALWPLRYLLNAQQKALPGTFPYEAAPSLVPMPLQHSGLWPSCPSRFTAYSAQLPRLPWPSA